MPTPQIKDYDVSQMILHLDDDGQSASLACLTDDGRVVLFLRREVLQHLVDQTKVALSREAAASRRKK